MLNKQDIATLPFAEIRAKIKTSSIWDSDEISARDTVVESFLETFKIAEKYNWILPQMIARFGNWKNIDNDGYQTFLENTKDDFNYGIWLIATRPRNKILLPHKGLTQYKLPDYNALVPLILSGFKKYQGINYSNWKNAQWLVDEALYKAMTAEVPEMSIEDILQFRVRCQTTKTGKNAGRPPNPATTATFYHLADWEKHDMTKVPKLALHMLCQTWCAHPSNRNPSVQVLDPRDWDNAPAPLINQNMFNEPEIRW